jgi:hypothetical protein
MTYEKKRQRWKQVQCKSWTDPDYSFLISELDRAWSALEAIGNGDDTTQGLFACRERARKALNE